MSGKDPAVELDLNGLKTFKISPETYPLREFAHIQTKVWFAQIFFETTIKKAPYWVMADNDELPDAETGTITKSKPKTETPKLYKVLLLNDDFTPMDFVILVIKKFFMKSDAEATRIMLAVHNEGAGLAGIYTFEVAETKVYTVNEFSRRHKHPLKCIMEKE